MQAILPALIGAENVLSTATIIRLLNFAVGLVQDFTEGDDRLTELNAFVEKLVEESRDPTEDEWNDLLARGLSAHDRIQNA